MALRLSKRTDPNTTLYERVGGDAFFIALVDEFYVGVETDPLLRPMYPADLTDSKAHLAMFFAQYFGGPATYSEVRGHPRLRMRHSPFVIDVAARDAWLRHMLASVDASGVSGRDREELVAYFDMAAHQLRNA